MTNSGFQPRVIVVGAGPVGLALAADLGWRGDAPPADPRTIIDVVRGARPAPSESVSSGVARTSHQPNVST